ncbi:hypothetical protein [Rathayibacter sp. VKM Ac-2760]|uniref:hypothetical protein n=1 Tax=Rathayibacter sp. VKM Ac-2760 TaxID=2609253 RepID=UPI0013161AFB|nr:hypothetical protein [Rathayibacter sp. VKM Ac-2760]QHC57167.1 hypothetical protein GSU72_00190 [Rathayibacter sp. VKM Ac-2760]
MLDLLFVIGVLAVFALLGLVARGVESLAPRPAGSGPRAAEDEAGPRAAGSGAAGR